MGLIRRLLGGPEGYGQGALADSPKVFARLEGPGRFEFDIVGESYYQDSLERICGGRCYNGHRKEVEALLLHHDDNRYDDMAVAVLIEEELVVTLVERPRDSFAREC